MNTQAQAQLFINFKRTLIILSAFTFDKLLLKFASVFRGMDNVVLGSVKAKWKNINDKATIIRNIFDRIETNSPSQKLYIGWIIDASIKLSFIRDNFTYPEESERDVLNDTNIFQPFNIIQSDFNSYSNDIYTNLLELIGILPDTKEFVQREPNDPTNNIKKIFLFYDEMGQYIHESPRYKGSNLDKLEDILVDAQDGIQRHIQIRPGMDRLDLAKTFIALVSPSLTGKTQSVFVMKRVRALYFCFQIVQSNNDSQKVYQMFNSFSNMLCDLADLDMKSLSRNFTSRLQEAYQQENAISGGNRTSKTFNGIYSEISANNLENGLNYKGHKFFTLGFLKGLIEHAEEHYTVNDSRSWMKYYAEAKNFRFPAVTVEEFKNFYSRVPNKYYVFVDEFVGKCSAVLARNLCRAVGLRCVTANTNSDIVNLLGVLQSFKSRNDARIVWSLVTTLLNPITFDDMEFADNLNLALDSYFQSYSTISDWYFVYTPTNQLNSEIERIIRNGSASDESYQEYGYLNSLISYINEGQENPPADLSMTNEKINLARFFIDFKFNQVHHLRPGLAFILPLALKSFTKLNCTVNELIDHLVSFVSIELSSRKTELVDSIHGRIGSLALYLKNSYETEKISATIEHRKSLLKNHFYYLLNPSDDKSPFFLTVLPGEYDDKLRIFYNKSPHSSHPKTCTWDYELTYFEKRELITVLACMTSRFSTPIAIDIKKGAYESFRANIDLGSTPNHLSLKSDGNPLEVLSTSTIMEASQHEHGNPSALSLMGQNGINFIQNIILNLMTGNSGIIRENLIKIEFPKVPKNAFNLKNILENFKIPFFYIANSENPEILSSLTTLGSLNVGDCYRTSDKNEIDINFSFEYTTQVPVPESTNRKRPRTSTGSKSTKNSIIQKQPLPERRLKFRGIGECKNYSNNVPVAELIRIIEKALKQNDSRLSLVFCTKIKNYTEETFQKFREFCTCHDVRVFRFSKIGSDFFKVIQFNSASKLSNNQLPRLICIVFEINEIDIRFDDAEA